MKDPRLSDDSHEDRGLTVLGCPADSPLQLKVGLGGGHTGQCTSQVKLGR